MREKLRKCHGIQDTVVQPRNVVKGSSRTTVVSQGTGAAVPGWNTGHGISASVNLGSCKRPDLNVAGEKV